MKYNLWITIAFSLAIIMMGIKIGLMDKKLKHMEREFLNETKANELIIYFDNVAGLKEGDTVTFEGYPAGKIAEIKVMPDKFAVIVTFSKRIKLHKNSKASKVSSSLLGEDYLVITRGDGDELQVGETLRGEIETPVKLDVLGEFFKDHIKDKQLTDKENKKEEKK